MSPIKRSSWSILFDVRVRSMALPEVVLNEPSSHWSRLSEFAPHMAIMCPNFATGELKFEHAGDEICRKLGRSLAGSDHLNAVPPSMRAATIDAVRQILEQPCGLWQVVPARTGDGQPATLEHTIFPLKDVNGANSKLIAYLHVSESGGKPSSAVAAPPALAREWMDLGFGVPQSTASKGKGAASVLVVEDDWLVRTAAVTYLHAFGFTVCAAANADAALAILEANDPPIDAIFTDINMPGSFDGVELARRVSARWPHIPVIMTSGAPPVAVSGIVGFFAKPYQIEDIASAIQAAVQRA